MGSRIGHMQQKSRRAERLSSNTCSEASSVFGSSAAHSLGRHWFTATRATTPAVERTGKMPPPVVCVWGRPLDTLEGA